MKNLTGVDVNIEISLKEYGFAWEIKEDEIVFWYGIRYNDTGYTLFDWASFENNLDVELEFDWANFDDVAEFVGETLEDWRLIPLVNKIHDLSEYYGFENMFGGSCFGGKTFQEVLDN